MFEELDAWDHASILHDFWVDVDNREIWIRGIDTNFSLTEGIEPGTEPGVEYMMATKTIMNLSILRNQGNDPVVIHLHTCGGVWEEGMAIYDAIQGMPYHVTIISYTHARSMSSIIFQAGDLRLCAPNSYVMLHKGTLAYEDSYANVVSNLEQSKKDNETMMNLYVESVEGSTKFKELSRNKIREYLERTMSDKVDVFLSPQEAMEWGLADGIFHGWNKNGTMKYTCEKDKV